MSKPRKQKVQTVISGSLLLLACTSILWLVPATVAQDNDAEAELNRGIDFLRGHRYEDALKSFKHANELRGRTCADCFYHMAQAYHGLAAYKNVIESCDKAIELAPSDKGLIVNSYNLKGMALVALADRKDQKRLQEAENALRQGMAVDARLPILHYNLGVTLMEQSRDAEGAAELKKYLELKPDAGNAEETRRMIENPRRTREMYAPDFSFTTADGQYLTTDDLRGKVVLLDFWGTWCPPCRDSVPSLRDLNKRYAKEKGFVMISVSVRDEEDKWRDFTAKNQMVWPQAFDRDSRIQRAFAVNRFPTYILIDHEGIIRFRASGFGFDREATLIDAIHKAIKVVAKTAPSE